MIPHDPVITCGKHMIKVRCCRLADTTASDSMGCAATCTTFFSCDSHHVVHFLYAGLEHKQKLHEEHALAFGTTLEIMCLS